MLSLGCSKPVLSEIADRSYQPDQRTQARLDQVPDPVAASAEGFVTNPPYRICIEKSVPVRRPGAGEQVRGRSRWVGGQGEEGAGGGQEQCP